MSSNIVWAFSLVVAITGIYNIWAFRKNRSISWSSMAPVIGVSAVLFSWFGYDSPIEHGEISPPSMSTPNLRVPCNYAADCQPKIMHIPNSVKEGGRTSTGDPVHDILVESRTLGSHEQINRSGMNTVVLLNRIGPKAGMLCKAFLSNFIDNRIVNIRAMDGATYSVRGLYWLQRTSVARKPNYDCKALLQDYDLARAKPLIRQAGLTGSGPYIVTAFTHSNDTEMLVWDFSDVPLDEAWDFYALFTDRFQEPFYLGGHVSANGRQFIKSRLLNISSGFSALFGIKSAEAQDGY